MDNSKKSLLLITKTALLIALLIVFQLTTAYFGQFVTGSLVNLILIIAAFSVGLFGGLAVAVISPLIAFLFGIGPAFIQIVPFIMLANAAIVTVVYLVAGKKQTLERSAAGVIGGAVLKFLILWIGVSKVLLPFIPGLKEKQITLISAAFSWPQLVTACIGGALAIIIWYSVRAALNSNKNRSAK